MLVKKTYLTVIAVMLLSGINSSVNAADDAVSVHGYGDTGFIRAIENNFTQKPGGNNWNYNYLSVNFTARIDEKTKIVAQIRQGSEITGDMGAYINHNMTDNLTLRAGQIKAPIGSFNEIRDIKFLQLSALTPLMYQDAVGYLPDSFKGIEAIYHMDMGTHRMTFDIYGGEPKGANSYIDRGTSPWQPADHYFQLVQNIYGGRLTYKTPIGFKFALSTFQNNILSTHVATPFTAPSPNGATNPTDGIRRAHLASIDYRQYDVDFKMEYAYAKDEFATQPRENNEGESYYAQIGYTFAQKFTPFIRYDYLLYQFVMRGDPRSEQRTKVLGFNYRLNNNVSMRMENHWHSGYAMPYVVQGSNFNSATAKLDWNMFAMGVNFIF